MIKVICFAADHLFFCAGNGYSVRKVACGDDLYDTSKRPFVDLVWEIKIAYEG